VQAGQNRGSGSALLCSLVTLFLLLFSKVLLWIQLVTPEYLTTNVLLSDNDHLRAKQQSNTDAHPRAVLTGAKTPTAIFEATHAAAAAYGSCRSM
jgi:uncharacterized membrane protein